MLGLTEIYTPCEIYITKDLRKTRRRLLNIVS